LKLGVYSDILFLLKNMIIDSLAFMPRCCAAVEFCYSNITRMCAIRVATTTVAT